MKTTSTLRSFLVLAGSSLLAISISHAADVTWDINPGTIGAGDSAVTGGTGAWNTSSAAVPNGNWTTDAGANNIAWVNANNDTAVFGDTAGTVTLDEAITVGGLTFNTASYLITGNTLTLASGAILHSTVATSNSNDPVITSELAGTNGFTKTGNGWVGLEGTATSSLSGDINIAAGTLYARFSALGSGNLVFTGNSNFTKVYGSPNAATTGFTINDGVTASIGGSTFYYNFATDGPLVGNISAKLVIQTGGNTQKDFNSTSNTFAGELTLGGGGTADNGQRTGFKSLADSNQKIIINDALFRLNNGGVSMNFANRQLEMLTNNARLDNDSTNSAVTMSFAQDLSVKTGNNGRILYLTGANTGNNTFSGVIGNSSTGTGATQVRKQEGGTWILNPTNTYTGKTTVDNGTLVVSSLKDIGTDSSVGKGGTLQLGYYNTTGTLRYEGAGDSTDRPIQINDYTNGTGNTGAGRILNNGAGALTFTASTFIPTNEVVVANRSLELGGSYTGAANEIQGIIQDIAPIAGKAVVSVVKRNDDSTWVLSGANAYTGTTTVSGGTLASTNAVQGFGTNLSGISIGGSGTLSLRNDSSVSFTNGTSAYNINNSASGATINVDRVSGTGAVTMSVGNLTTSSTAGDWGLNFTGANDVSLSAGTLSTPVSTIAAVHTITNNIAGGGSLTLASVFNQATTIASPDLVFTGTGTTTVTGAITQTLADMELKKSGTGTLLLNGTNTYTGLTTVSAGTLGGIGLIAGDVTVAAAGSLAPGESAGTLSIGGGLDVSAPANGGAGKLNFELGPIAASDKLALTGSGTLTIGAGVLGFTDFNFDALAGLQNGTYKLITSGSPVSGTLDAADLSGLIDGGPGSGTLQISTSGTDIELIVSGIGTGTPYQSWSGGAAFDTDANNDGVDNGLAFLLGAANPNENALGLLPTVDESGGGLVLTFSMLNAASRGAATLNLEHSGDLGIADAWTAVLVPDTTPGSPTSGVTFTVTPGSPKNTVTATISSSEALSGKLFGRLKASE